MRALLSGSAMARIGMLRVRSSERTWLHSRSASKFSSERYDEQIVVAVRGAEQGLARLLLDVDALLLGEHGGDALMRGRPIIDNKYAAVAAGVIDSLTRRRIDADLAR